MTLLLVETFVITVFLVAGLLCLKGKQWTAGAIFWVGAAIIYFFA